MPFVHGYLIDRIDGQPLAGKVCVLDAGGRPAFPDAGIRKVGPGLPGFYADGEFLVEVPSGLTTIEVERGTEYCPFRWTGRVDAGAPHELVIALDRWTDLPARGWYPGNTHIHYDEHETNPDGRLRLDPEVHDLKVTVVSVIQRRDLPYAVNRYPVGLLTEFMSAHHIVDCGEESRHNCEPWTIGYGHVLFLKLQEAVSPLSRGVLVNDTDPDYPPLCYACDETHRQGGTVIWCHNGAGMEAPVAAALGKLDAFNLFDPYWVLPEEYTIWYRMLNCGLRLPASTGSDWYICSNNRVYVQVDGSFTYDGWLDGLKAGRTFITNGPALFLRAGDGGPGDTLNVTPDQPLEVEISWQAHRPIDSLELLHNGVVVARQAIREDQRTGKWRVQVLPQTDGWIAARASGNNRDSFWQPAFAHTSPLWLIAGRTGSHQATAARAFVQDLDRGMAWVARTARFATERQRAEVIDLFRAGQDVYRKLM